MGDYDEAASLFMEYSGGGDGIMGIATLAR
jgi:hypothetical protein